jgi:hypothetical protein
MGKQSALRPEVVIAILLGVAVGTVAAQGRQVTKLRTDKVTLFSCAADEREGLLGQFSEENKEVARTTSPPEWPILSEPSKAGRLVVKVGEKLYCVRAYAVETNKPIHTEADCGTMVAAAQPRSGATRGLGQNCSQEKRK